MHIHPRDDTSPAAILVLEISRHAFFIAPSRDNLETIVCILKLGEEIHMFFELGEEIHVFLKGLGFSKAEIREKASRGGAKPNRQSTIQREI